MLHSTDALALPPRPDVSQYRKLAKDLLAAVGSDEPSAVRDWAREWLEKLRRLTREDRTPEGGEKAEGERRGGADATKDDGRAEGSGGATGPDPRGTEQFARDVQAYWSGERVPERTPPPSPNLAGAQWFIARVHGFATWADLVRYIEENRREDTAVGRFEAAVDAVVGGDIDKLRRLLRDHPELATARSSRGHGATLLHYVSANGVEGYRQRTPPNIVEITRLLLDAGADVNAGANCYGANDRTIYLAATSMHPEQAGVMIDLLEILLAVGADIGRREGEWGIVRSCLANGQGEAAAWLAEHGAELDLEEAAGVGSVDVVKRFVAEDGSLQNGATAAQLRAGFQWAAAYGRPDVVRLLIDRGVDAKMVVEEDSNALHWAAYGGNREVVDLLLAHGVPANIREKAHGGTPIDWAVHGWANTEPQRSSDETYYAVVAALARAGSQPHEGWRDESSPGPAWKRLRSDRRMLAALEGRSPE
jgi:ankyrin repeat protein